jgi:hypothetical protein
MIEGIAMRVCNVINCVDRRLFRLLRGFRYDNASFEWDDDASDDGNDDHRCWGPWHLYEPPVSLPAKLKLSFITWNISKPLRVT